MGSDDPEKPRRVFEGPRGPPMAPEGPKRDHPLFDHELHRLMRVVLVVFYFRKPMRVFSIRFLRKKYHLGSYRNTLKIGSKKNRLFMEGLFMKRPSINNKISFL
jgi:hypothetical protein